jgi:hypothetical protein
MLSFIFSCVLSAVLLLTALEKRKYLETIFYCLVSLAIAFNAFIISQSYLPTVGPSYQDLLTQMYGYNGGYDVSQIYALSFAESTLVHWGLGSDHLITLGTEGPVRNFSGYLYMLDFQLSELPIFQETKGIINSRCTVKKEFFSNGFKSGYIFRCGEPKDYVPIVAWQTVNTM